MFRVRICTNREAAVRRVRRIASHAPNEYATEPKKGAPIIHCEIKLAGSLSLQAGTQRGEFRIIVLQPGHTIPAHIVSGVECLVPKRAFDCV